MANSSKIIDYMGTGNAASRPASLVGTIAAGVLGLWWSQDTGELDGWTGSAWAPVGGGTVTKIVAGTGLAGGTIVSIGTISLGTIAASSLMGNSTTVGAVPGAIAIGAGITLSVGGTLSAAGSGGSVTSIVAQGGPFLANGTVTATGTISNSITSLTAHGVLLGEGTLAVAATAALTNGQMLLGVTGADPAPQTMSGDATINSGGTFTLGSLLAAGTIGSASLIPIITYDQKGRITVVGSAAPVVNSVVTLTGTAGGTLTLTGTAGFQDMDFIINAPAAGGTVHLTAAPAATPPRQRYVIDINQGATLTTIVPDTTFVFNSGITAYPTDTVNTTTRMSGITPNGTKVAVWAIIQGSTI